uniref:Uncharacterized protein n=1 Tax=Lates calcarifer TaxID=8187 RepID=A0A4W6CSF5_LATCA
MTQTAANWTIIHWTLRCVAASVFTLLYLCYVCVCGHHITSPLALWTGLPQRTNSTTVLIQIHTKILFHGAQQKHTVLVLRERIYLKQYKSHSQDLTQFYSSLLVQSDLISTPAGNTLISVKNQLGMFTLT